MFVQEPRLPATLSVYVNNYNQQDARALYQTWVDNYCVGVSFHQLNFEDFKAALDHAFHGPRDRLRFDAWEYVTKRYLYHNETKLMEAKLAYIQSRRDDITTCHGKSNKLKP
jgi:hypothetical protein